ncbi:MAG: chemotaxis protein CheB [Rhodocyclales bacterium]|nr:chemotaxis protein CheB [Rhodocyclales bacterium]
MVRLPGTSPVSSAASAIDAIVIGTSAGGVEALSVLLPALPATLRAAVFIVMHLPRERPSLLAEIFRAKCACPVSEAQDKEPVLPGSVYFAPPDYHLLIDKGPHLALSTDELVNYSRPAIDVLFESAADIYRERLLGIILTGANQDGAAGLKAVHRLGGTALVQRPDSAQASLMPQSAIAQCPTAHVLSLEQMADLLRTLEDGNALDLSHATN